MHALAHVHTRHDFRRYPTVFFAVAEPLSPAMLHAIRSKGRTSPARRRSRGDASVQAVLSVSGTAERAGGVAAPGNAGVGGVGGVAASNIENWGWMPSYIWGVREKAISLQGNRRRADQLHVAARAGEDEGLEGGLVGECARSRRRGPLVEGGVGGAWAGVRG